MSSKEKEITRKDFLKKTACLILCPVFMKSISSCGKAEEENGNQDKISSDTDSSETGVKVEKNIYESMSVGDTISINLDGTSNGILLYKKSQNSFLAFNATCPHAGGVVQNSSNDQLGICSLHGATFQHSGVSDSGPAEGQTLFSYPVIVKSEYLLIKV